MKSKGASRSRDEQRWDRERRDEHAFLFGPTDQFLGRVEREEWDFAISTAGGDVVEAAKQVGIDVPRGTRALWGRSQEAALGAYRSWMKRKARKKKK